MCVHFLQLYRQVLKDIQYVLITYVWQYEILKEFEKWSLVLLKKKKTTNSLQVSFQTHSCETQEHLLKYNWQSGEICHIQQALFRFAPQLDFPIR